jgi:23S rRNA (adenine2503-C2)-methyltransferase
MGMGEPMLNYANVMAAIEKITSPKGLNMASRRITVSTVGVAKMIKKMADDNPKFNLAVSLHAALNETRSSIMPINDTNPLEELAEALQYWYQKTKKQSNLRVRSLERCKRHTHTCASTFKVCQACAFQSKPD